MKLSCTQNNLSEGLSIVSHLATKNIQLPILSHVLIQIEDRVLKLTSTNLEIAVSVTLRAKVDDPGAFTVPAKLLADFVNLLSADRVDLEQSGDSLTVSSKTTNTTIRGAGASDFPLIPKIEQGDKYTVSAPELKRALERVIFAAAPTQTRPELTGVLFRFDAAKGELALAATDSFRLAEARVRAEAKTSGSFILPARAVSEVVRILGGVSDDLQSGDSIEITRGESQVLFSYRGVELISRVIEERYPDYQNIIPEKFLTTVRLERAALANAVRTASLFSRSGLYDVMLKIIPGESVVEIAASDGSVGESKSRLPAEISGGQNSITLNFRYLLDGVGASPGEFVSLRMNDAGSPCLLVPAAADASKEGAAQSDPYLYLVMPIRQ